MRIISLAPNITDILVGLGLGGNIIASTNFCNINSEKIGGWINLDYKKIKELNADYVISCIFKPDFKESKKLIHFDVFSLKDIYKMIGEIGELFNKEEEANSLINYMRLEFEKIKNKSKHRKRLRVYFEEFPYFASGNWVPEIAEICNAETILGKGERSRKISFKEVDKFKPELAILHYCGFKTTNIESFLNRRGWNDLEVIKRKKVFSISDDYLNKPSHYLVRGAFELNRIIEGCQNNIIK